MVSYEDVPPFCEVMEIDGKLIEIKGSTTEVVNHICQAVNLTVKYVPFKERNIWSRKNSDGSWSGGLADVASGEHVTSAAAFISTLERFEIGKNSNA